MWLLRRGVGFCSDGEELMGQAVVEIPSPQRSRAASAAALRPVPLATLMSSYFLASAGF